MDHQVYQEHKDKKDERLVTCLLGHSCVTMATISPTQGRRGPPGVPGVPGKKGPRVSTNKSQTAVFAALLS